MIEALSEDEAPADETEEELAPEEAAALIEALSEDQPGEQPSPEELDALVDVLGQLSQPGAGEGSAAAPAEEVKSSSDRQSKGPGPKEARRKIARKLLEELLTRSRG